MPWTISDLRAETTAGLPAACGSTYYAWRRAIRDQGLHPKEAAEQVGDTRFEYYDQGQTKGTIRLSQRHRVFFTVNAGAEEVVVNKVGTHNQPRGW